MKRRRKRLATPMPPTRREVSADLAAGLCRHAPDPLASGLAPGIQPSIELRPRPGRLGRPGGGCSCAGSSVGGGVGVRGREDGTTDRAARGDRARARMRGARRRGSPPAGRPARPARRKHADPASLDTLAGAVAARRGDVHQRQHERGQARQGAVLGHAGRQRRPDRVRDLPLQRRRRQPLAQPGQPADGGAFTARARTRSSRRATSRSTSSPTRRTALGRSRRTRRTSSARRASCPRPFGGVTPGDPPTSRRPAPDPIFSLGGIDVRRTTGAQHAVGHQRGLQLPQLLGRPRAERLQRRQTRSAPATPPRGSARSTRRGGVDEGRR